MSTRYQPALDLVDRFLQDRLVSRIWDRDIGAWGAAPGSSRREIHRDPAGLAGHRRDHAPAPRTAGGTRRGGPGRSRSRRSTSSAWAAAACAPKCCAACSASPTARRSCTSSTRPTSGRSRRGRGAHGPRAHVVPGLEQERRDGRGRVDGALLLGPSVQPVARRARRPPVHRHHRPGHRAADAGASRGGYREVFVNPADIGGRFSALSLFGLVPDGADRPLRRASAPRRRDDGGRLPAGECTPTPGLELGAFIGAAAQQRPGQAHGRCCRRRWPSLGLWIEQLDRGEHRQAWQGRAAGRGRAARPPRRIRRRSRVRRDRAPTRRSRRTRGCAALEAAGHPVLRLEHAARRHRRRVLPLGVRHGGRRRGARHQPVRRAERLGGQGEDQGAARLAGRRGHLPEPRPPRRPTASTVFSHALRRRLRQPRSCGAALATLAPPDYVAFLSYLPPDSEVAQAVAEIRAGHPRSTHVASTFGVGPRYLHSTGQYHKGGPNTALAFVVTADDETQTRDSGGRATRSRC